MNFLFVLPQRRSLRWILINAVKIFSFALWIHLTEVCGFRSIPQPRGVRAVGRQAGHVTILGCSLAVPREGGFLHGDLHSWQAGSTCKAFQVFCSWKWNCPQVRQKTVMVHQYSTLQLQGVKPVCLGGWVGVQPACALCKPKLAQLH